MKNSVITQNVKPILTVNPWKFIVWLFIVASIMLFASQTSAYLVRRAEGNWNNFDIPVIFYFSTAVLLISSIFMALSLKAAKKDEFSKLKLFITITTILGIIFLVMQYIGWQQLQLAGIYIKGNPSGSFYYVLTGLHAVHLVSGLFVLLYSFIGVYSLKIHSKNLIRLEVCATYWHFLDFLWVYLFVFLVFFR